MLDFCIIGSGISGSTIANCLNKKYKLLLYDKAKGAGGRSSFKRYKGNIGFDHGLQYLSPRSKEFKSFTNSLIKKRVIKGEDIIGRNDYFNKVQLDSSFPTYLLENKGKYKDWIDE